MIHIISVNWCCFVADFRQLVRCYSSMLFALYDWINSMHCKEKLDLYDIGENKFELIARFLLLMDIPRTHVSFLLLNAWLSVKISLKFPLYFYIPNVVKFNREIFFAIFFLYFKLEMPERLYIFYSFSLLIYIDSCRVI